MRQVLPTHVVLTYVLLIPVLAHSQTGSQAEAKRSSSPVVLQAELKHPADLATMAASGYSGRLAIHETVHEEYSGDFLEAALRLGGTLEYSMKSSAPAQTAPKVTQAVEVQLSPEELAQQPAVSNVVVRAIVDEHGIPRNVAVTHSAGKVLDERAVAAVSQYRFTPATIDNRATWATVSIAINIQK
jgi:TonB family protein